MEASVFLAIIGAVVGAAASAFWFGIDLMCHTHTLDADRSAGVILVCTVALPVICGAIYLLSDNA